MISKAAVLVGATLAVTSAFAQEPFTPLAEKRFEYTALPYKADTGTGERGTQFGYNICNSTTEGQNSLCQTSMINSIDGELLLMGPPEPNSLIGDTEGEAVAWCTKPGRGTRLIPAGALTGVQFMRTPSYVQVTGRIRQELINIEKNDSGGEMDPHGADRRGNPLGGLLFSNAFPSNNGNNNTYQQVVEWHNFMEKDSSVSRHATPQTPMTTGTANTSTIVLVAGVTPPPHTLTALSSHIQPTPESLGPITTVPYDPKIPASSNCVTFQSAALYTGLPGAATPSSSAVTTSAPAVTGNGAGTRAGGTPASTTPTGGTNVGASTSGAVGSSGFTFLATASIAFSALVGALAVL
ncbi:hypothetical protein RHS01_04109 [Rhizoctonia solani]|uniref:Uncharacterized protein n=1 Tax=Rhizoctonia solani TaxID=456999 RepID=A0A8H7IDW8_9AGAM|nr:hypothetical protein RHS01_04109 [Rhizoctonia solani]